MRNAFLYQHIGPTGVTNFEKESVFVGPPRIYFSRTRLQTGPFGRC